MTLNWTRPQFQRVNAGLQLMPAHIRRGNATRSKHRAPIEHVFAVQKQAMSLTIRTIGIARAKTKIDMANLAYNIRRLEQIRRSEAA